MGSSTPRQLTVAERQLRNRRASRIARGLAFEGRVEYRHIYSQTGGAQYGRADAAERDVLIVYAEAFERDADPDDFSLEAIIAHERGHQLIARHPPIRRVVSGRVSLASEEILASLLGAMICSTAADRDALAAKAIMELVDRGVQLDEAVLRLQQLWELFEGLL